MIKMRAFQRRLCRCGRLVENEYLGLKNGIMDQFICLGASKGLLTVVDCCSRSLSQHTPPWVASGESADRHASCNTFDESRSRTGCPKGDQSAYACCTSIETVQCLHHAV